MMTSFRVFGVVSLLTVWYISASRSDPAEGSRLLEEAFRDYDKRIRPNYGGSPVVVNVSLHLLSLPKIDTSQMTFQLSFFVRQIWIDPRFFFNSRRNIDTIMLDAVTSERIWSPDTYFVNELSSVNHDILVKNQFCRISQNGTVLLSRRVTLTAFVNMDSSMFPYDINILDLDLESYGSQIKDLKYQWADDAVSISPFMTPGFTIGNIQPAENSLTTSTGSYSRLTIKIEAKRNAFVYELGFMLPTSLLALLCWCSMWTKNKSFGTSTTIYLVSLMVMMNAILLLSGLPLLSPLQIHSFISCVFGLICLTVNLRNERCGVSCSRNSKGIIQSKSRTESTSENCKIDDLPYGATLDNNHGQLAGDPGEHNGVTKCLKRCRSIEWEYLCGFVTLFVLITLNVIYFVTFRLLV